MYTEIKIKRGSLLSQFSRKTTFNSKPLYMVYESMLHIGGKFIFEDKFIDDKYKVIYDMLKDISLEDESKMIEGNNVSQESMLKALSGAFSKKTIHDFILEYIEKYALSKIDSKYEVGYVTKNGYIPLIDDDQMDYIYLDPSKETYEKDLKDLTELNNTENKNEYFI